MYYNWLLLKKLRYLELFVKRFFLLLSSIIFVGFGLLEFVLIFFVRLVGFGDEGFDC